MLVGTRRPPAPKPAPEPVWLARWDTYTDGQRAVFGLAWRAFQRPVADKAALHVVELLTRPDLRRVDAEGRVLTAPDGALAVDRAGGLVDLRGFVHAYLREHFDWLLARGGAPMFEQLTRQVVDLEAAHAALKATLDRGADDRAVAEALAQFDEKFRAPDGQGSVATPQARAAYADRVRAGRAEARRAAVRAFKAATKVTTAALAAAIRASEDLPDEVTAVTSTGTVSRQEWLLLRIASRLDAQATREDMRTATFRDRVKRYKAAAADEASDRAFIRLFEADPLAGLTSDDDASQARAVQAQVRQRRQARVPSDLRALEARVAATGDLVTRLSLVDAGSPA
jgi:hypothetical protein